jgi:hypothetical protein
MKKNFALAFILIAAFAIFSCKQEPKKAVVKGVINFLSGTVTLEKTGTKLSAKVGDEVTEGMKLVTGDKSVAEIYFGENAIKVIENSALEISKLAKDEKNGEQTSLSLDKGRVFARVVKKLSRADEFLVKTPTAVAAIRGTDFVVSQTDNKSTIACLKGKVQVSESGNDTAKVDLNQGQEVDVEKGKKLDVKSIKDENLKNLQKIIDDIREIREDIRKKFEDQKAEIKQKLEDQKDANRQMMDKQKQMNTENIQKQKDADKENVSAIKSELTDKKEEIKSGLKNFEKPDFKNTKPQLK